MTNKPNILIIMVDQLNGKLFDNGPLEWLHAPNLKKLAKQSICFKNTYTASPLCAPARASFMSGQLPSNSKVYDNAAEFASSIPTYAHHLRRAGYQTCLSGKMHFVGPDQLHGFEERLTTDIYPADFGWTPDYRKPGERISWWYHNLGSVTGAGIAEISNQLEYDDEVAYHAVRKIYDLARKKDDRPWCLTASFTHPHDPYLARKKYWDLYEDCEHLLPEVNALDYDDMDNHSQRIFDANDWRNFHITTQNIKDSRRAYFANISYLDDKIGEILHSLEMTDQQDDTIIVFLSDHGDMLGERGLWFKMSFFEGSARVPLMMKIPSQTSKQISTAVSTIDVLPTLAEISGTNLKEIKPWLDGESLISLIDNNKRDTPVFLEYAAEGSYAPLVATVKENLKLILCQLDPPLLYDLDKDPFEMTNVYENPAYSSQRNELEKLASEKWDLDKFDSEVRESQAKRWIVYEALRNGHYYPWDYQPIQQASERYMRNHMDLNDVESNQRYPKQD